MQNAECRIENAANAEQASFCILHSAFCIRAREPTMTATTPEPAHAHHPFLQHHFEDRGQQHEASTLGMWLFLTTEILLSGGVLLAYWLSGIHYARSTPPKKRISVVRKNHIPRVEASCCCPRSS